MKKVEGFDDVIGRASDLAPDLDPMPPLAKRPVMAVVGLDELKEPSPRPLSERGHNAGANPVQAEKVSPGRLAAQDMPRSASRLDIDYPELDSLEPLYTPKFLLRRWGPTKFFNSAYYRVWKSQAERSTRLGSTDLKPSEQRKKR